MWTWLSHFWGRISASLWFLPVLMSLGALALAVVIVFLDEPLATAMGNYGYLYGGDVESARELLSAVASSIITVTGVAFSVTMVALSLTSSQFGPHLLANFMRDRGNQVVLGGFIGTFLFCLLALGTVTTDAESHASLSASIALLLAGISMMLLIYFIHHIASSMQADHVIELVAGEAGRALDRLFPAESEQASPPKPEPREAREIPVEAPRTGYLQAIDEDGLTRLATSRNLRLDVLHRPGHYVIEGRPLVAVSTGPELDDEVIRRIQRGFIIGGHRAPEQDPEYGIHQLVEVAVRALSSGINDPYTAVACVDRLTGVLCRIGPRRVRSAKRADEDGHLRLTLDTTDFAGVLDAAFNQIRQSATDQPAVTLRLLESLSLIATTVESASRREAIARQGAMVMAAHRDVLVSDDRVALEQRYRSLQDALVKGCTDNAPGRPSPPESDRAAAPG